MASVSEITVIIKDEEKTLKKKFLIYDPYQVSQEDPTIKNCIEETLKNFAGEPAKITVKIHFIVE
jgi:hypothetical protein